MNVDSLRISGVHYDALREHLFPGDGLEAVAFALCGRHQDGHAEILTVRTVIPLPYEICKRAGDHITWPTEFMATFLDEARRRRLAVVKFHSHPGPIDTFSRTDDESDRNTFSSVFTWLDDGASHGSAIILPDGRIVARSIQEDGWTPFVAITVVGDDIFHWTPAPNEGANGAAFKAQQQLFGAGTTKLLHQLRIGIVGCSGTGSIAVELLARLGVGTLTLVDPDKIQDRNLNRILNSKRTDIGRAKVEVLAEAVNSMGLGTVVSAFDLNLFDTRAVNAIAACDIVFGCMDTAEGRQLLNRIATFYILPYFDLGVHFAADGQGGINEASGVVHYLQPGRSSLVSRKAYTLERVRAENIYRTDPEAYKEQVKAGYIDGVEEHSPAVVSANAAIASIAVNELLARIHPFRSCPNSDCAIIRFNLMETMVFKEEELSPCPVLSRHVGRGDTTPLLDMPTLSKPTP